MKSLFILKGFHAVRIWIPTQVSVKVRHLFSVELCPKAREFILSAHRGDEEFHVFGNVDIFAKPRADHYCYACECEHRLPDSIDGLVSGTSCKSNSKMNRDRAQYAGSFST